MEMVSLVNRMPSDLRKVRFTFTVPLFGLTIASPKSRDKRPLALANITAFVVRSGVRTPVGIASLPVLRMPYVSKTTSPPIAVVALTGMAVGVRTA